MGDKRRHTERKVTGEKKHEGSLTDEHLYDLNPVVQQLEWRRGAATKIMTNEHIQEDVLRGHALITREIEAGKLPPEYGTSYTILDHYPATTWMQTYFPLKPTKTTARLRSSKKAALG